MPRAGGTVGAASPPRRPERILRVRAATGPRRLGAAVLDALVVLAGGVVLTLGSAALFGVPVPQVGQWLASPDLLIAALLDRNPVAVGGGGLLLGVAALYQMYFGAITGQTLGKRVFGLRTISVRGTAPGPARGLARFAALLLALAPVGLGFLWALFDRERRALHDHLAGTYVILAD